jgi:glutamine cyclotransferase
MKKVVLSIAAISILVLSGLTGCSPQVEVAEIVPLKARVTARQPVLSQMKTEGLCAENSTGMLARSANARLTVEQRTLIEEENFDRERIFDAIARAYELPVADIRALFVEMQPAR